MGQEQLSPDADGRDQVSPRSRSLLDELKKMPREVPPEGTTEQQIHAFFRTRDRQAPGRQASGRRANVSAGAALATQNADAYHLFGLLAAQLDEFDNALASFARAIELDPTVPEYHANRGNVLRIKSLLGDAEAAFTRALSLRPDFPEALMNLATVLRHRGDLEGAEKLLLPLASSCSQIGPKRRSTSQMWF